MKKIMFIATLLLCSSSIYAQWEICIFYDAAGNRIQRKLCCTACIVPPPEGGSEDRNLVTDFSSPSNVKVVPNPCRGLFAIHADSVPSNAKVTILDMTGKVILYKNFGQGQFDLSDQPPGIYVIRLAYDTHRKVFLLEKLNSK